MLQIIAHIAICCCMYEGSAWLRHYHCCVLPTFSFHSDLYESLMASGKASESVASLLITGVVFSSDFRNWELEFPAIFYLNIVVRCRTWPLGLRREFWTVPWGIKKT